MITYLESGDIFALPNVKAYAHGCNCAGAMGKGIALQFKSKFPEMYQQYRKMCLAGQFNLGDVFEYISEDKRVYNLGTQQTWKTKAELNAIKESVHKMFSIAVSANITPIAIPKIGAGLGGLNWEDVKAVLAEVSSEFPEIELIVVENYKAIK